MITLRTNKANDKVSPFIRILLMSSKALNMCIRKITMNIYHLPKDILTYFSLKK